MRIEDLKDVIKDPMMFDILKNAGLPTYLIVKQCNEAHLRNPSLIADFGIPKSEWSPEAILRRKHERKEAWDKQLGL